MSPLPASNPCCLPCLQVAAEANAAEVKEWPEAPLAGKNDEWKAVKRRLTQWCHPFPPAGPRPGEGGSKVRGGAELGLHVAQNIDGQPSWTDNAKRASWHG
jgi:hypothetical protein